MLLTACVTAFCSCTEIPKRSVENIASHAVANQKIEADKININSASVTEIEKLLGVGEVLAGRIIAYREEHGPFRRVEHLMMVRGISERKFREIKFLIKTE
jgi:competence protein ComEA